jgi:hypothetical protein
MDRKQDTRSDQHRLAQFDRRFYHAISRFCLRKPLLNNQLTLAVGSVTLHVSNSAEENKHIHSRFF